jgi:redox-sensitive bicupin YhaK (pirin superfamily)
VLSPTLYVDVTLAPGASVAVDGAHEDRAVYVVDGAVECAGQPLAPGAMTVLRAGADVSLSSRGAARAVLMGGAPLPGVRHIEWNFVSSSAERLQRAKDDWRAGRFPKVPGDEKEFIPLPPDRS